MQTREAAAPAGKRESPSGGKRGILINPSDGGKGAL